MRAKGIACDPTGLLDYVYAVLNWPGHRTRYADALRYEFARIPFARDAAAFGRVQAIGADLVRLHLVEHPEIAQALPALDGVDDAIVSKPYYDQHTSVIHLAPTLTARDVSPEVWSYQQGAYPALRNFLQAREGRRLASEEFAEFRRLVAVIRLTLDRLARLDEEMPNVAENAFTADELVEPSG